jgi:hypothetical protein
MLTPGTTFATLTAAQPHVANKGALVFSEPTIVEGGQGYAYFDASDDWGELYPDSTYYAELIVAGELAGFTGPPNTWPNMGSVSIWIHPPKGAYFLVDCAISCQVPPEATQGGTVSLTVAGVPTLFGADAQHAVTTIEPAGGTWTSLVLGSVGSIRWTFWSCTITNL